MKPQDKAKQLINIFDGKEPAIACVVEIINALDKFGYIGSMYDDFETGRVTTTDDKDPCAYWADVKDEIKKL